MRVGKAGLVGILLLSLVPPEGIGRAIYNGTESSAISDSEPYETDERLAAVEKQNFEKMVKEGEKSNDPRFYNQRFKSILGKRYLELNNDPKKRDLWSRYWEKPDREILKESCMIYAFPRYFLNNLSKERKKSYQKFKKGFNAGQIRKKGYFEYFCWINEKNMTEPDYLIIWNLDNFISSLTPKNP